MRFVIFCHSLVSDWNHGNAHFLRGVAGELLHRGHDVTVWEPCDGWSLTNLLRDHGQAAVDDFHRAYPALASQPYDPATLDLDRATAGADFVLVHEWTAPALVAALGAQRRNARHRLLFHDTHHRAVSAPAELAALDLSGYDGVLAFGASLAAAYRRLRLHPRVFAWHEAADTRVFYPRLDGPPHDGDLVWIGNWGDDERTSELDEFLIEPVRALGLRARVHGVRYPPAARARLASVGIEYAGWLPNHRVPEVFARFRVTVHVPRRHYTQVLPGIPTIRPFEALACGIPLVSAPWDDSEGLFEAGSDHLMARDGREMQAALRALLANPTRALAQARRGLARIRARHTCGHRVDELMTILAALAASDSPAPQPSHATQEARPA
jgi:spore maturation protein CgeB